MPYVRTRLGRWFYEESGERRAHGDPAIVLGHSYLCDGGMWRGQVAGLAALGRVINIDGPGHGKSEVPPPFTLEEHAEAMLDAFGELRIDDAVMIGLSWGAMVAMRFALAHPHRVAGLALLDTSARRQPLGERLQYRALIPLGGLLGIPRFLVESQVIPKMFAPATPREQPELVASFMRRVSGMERLGLTRAGSAIVSYRTDISRRIEGTRVPTLVLCGREDASTPPEESALLAARIPGARLVWVDGAGHLSALERPEIVARELESFVRSLS